jgi:hypothetical protein
VSFIRSRPDVLGVISLDLFAVLLGGATALFPIFAADILHTGPWGLGLLRAAPAAGALIISLWLARHALQRHVGMTMFAAVAGFGGSYKLSFTQFSSGHSHSFGGEYLELLPNERIAYTARFDDPNLPGQMRTTVTLKQVSCGTEPFRCK